MVPAANAEKLRQIGHEAWLALESELDEVCYKWLKVKEARGVSLEDMTKAIASHVGPDLAEYWEEWYGEGDE